MRGPFLAFSGTCLAMLIAACNGQTHGTPVRSSTKVEDGLRIFLQRYVKESRIDGATTRYFDAFVDLNGDGKKEVIVYLVGRWWCGSGGCPTLILSPVASSYRLVTKVLITRPPIRALPIRSYGWQNLSVWVQGGGVQQGYEAELAFDGQSYPTSPANPPAHPRTSSGPGEIVVPAEAYDFRNCKPLYP